MRVILSIAAAVAILAPAHARASTTQIVTPLGCVETVVTKSQAPTGSAMYQGGTLSFRDPIAPGQSGQAARIRSLYIPPGSEPIASAGDRVRVCLLSVPAKSGGCDPTTDARGLEFLVYVHTSDPTRQTNAAVYMNAEHNCGGA